MGLGETLLRMIERRQKMDIWMTYGGMVRSSLSESVHIWLNLSPDEHNIDIYIHTIGLSYHCAIAGVGSYTDGHPAVVGLGLKNTCSSTIPY